MPTGGGDAPSRSPWVAQLIPDGPATPLEGDGVTDVLVVGAGIAGVSTAFFLLETTDLDVVLVERARVGRGATGHNAGQLTSYFERPLSDIADEFGDDLALDAQRALDESHQLLDRIVATTAAPVRIERFTGHMGMYTLNHLEVHLRNSLLRAKGGLAVPACVVSEEAEFLADIPPEYTPLYSVVPQEHIGELLGTRHGQYRAVLSEYKGCANSAALTQHVLAYLLAAHGHRLRYHDQTLVEHIALGADDAVVRTTSGSVRAGYVVLCTNGFLDHVIDNLAGDPIPPCDAYVSSVLGYMTGFLDQPVRPPAASSFIQNQAIGGDTPYVYVTRRTYDHDDSESTLTCMGGPEVVHEGPVEWHASKPFPAEMIRVMVDRALPFALDEDDAPPDFDFHWHGLMGYTHNRIRVVGAEPRNHRLLYNLGCNGVGFLPSIVGGDRIAKVLGGEVVAPSIFDPR